MLEEDEGVAVNIKFFVEGCPFNPTPLFGSSVMVFFFVEQHVRIVQVTGFSIAAVNCILFIFLFD